jgi:hypothetical protein
MTVPNSYYLVFKVKACKSVYVLMAATFNNANTVSVAQEIHSKHRMCSSGNTQQTP